MGTSRGLKGASVWWYIVEMAVTKDMAMREAGLVEVTREDAAKTLSQTGTVEIRHMRSLIGTSIHADGPEGEPGGVYYGTILMGLHGVTVGFPDGSAEMFPWGVIAVVKLDRNP